MADVPDTTNGDIELVCLRSEILADRWKNYFTKFEPARVMAMDEFVRLLCSEDFQDEIDTHTIQLLWQKCVDHTRSTVSYQHFVNVISNRRNSSFTSAVERPCGDLIRELTAATPAADPPRLTVVRSTLNCISRTFLADETARREFVERYGCWPPPLLLVSVTIIQIACFVNYALTEERISLNRPLLFDGAFIYRPDRREEIWRFVFYFLSSIGWLHFSFNTSVQLLVGIPLEMVHGPLRVGAIYFSGLIAGSLGTSVFERDTILAGSSGGVYALLYAQFVFVVLNLSKVKIAYFPLPTLVVLGLADSAFAVWNRHGYSRADTPYRLGYMGHVMGALIGSTLGSVILLYGGRKLHARPVWWIVLSAAAIFFVFAILWNVFV